jgi:hypothetical protein
MLKTSVTVVAVSVLSLISACGDGSGTTVTTTTTTPVVQQTAEGIWNGTWNGTATPGGAVKMLVQADGKFYKFYGTTAPIGFATGTSLVDANNAFSYVTNDNGENISGKANIWLSASASTFIANTTLNYTVSGGMLNTSPRVIALTYDSSYTSPFTLANLVGNYSGATVGQGSTFSIDANGNITGNAARYIEGGYETTGTCPITGTITPNASKRFATVSITGCSTDSVDGVGVALLVGSGVGQQIYIGSTTGKLKTLYGVKQ